MSSETAYGFWSYAHEDNELDGGNILVLAHLIKEEYNLLSGEPLELFIDRDGIAWGEEWRKRIDSSLVQTTFFIPEAYSLAVAIFGEEKQADDGREHALVLLYRAAEPAAFLAEHPP
jgi:hypothetical protein